MGIDEESEYLDFPEPGSTYPAIYALGRMTAAWGGLEQGFFALLTAISATANPLEQTAEIGPSRKADFSLVKALYFSLDSTRARRRMVIDLAKARLHEGHISEELCDEIVKSCEAAEKPSKQRNQYSHVWLRFMRDGKVELNASDTFTDPPIKRRHPPSEIDKTTELIRSVSKRVFQLTLACLKAPLEQPPTL